MRKLLFVILAVLSIYPLLALTAGDIAIIAVNTDATKTVTFVALADIPANTTISFTDNAWNATTGAWRTGEGTIAWSYTSPVAAGTVITLTLGTTYTASMGDVTTSTNFNLAAAGDQILAYEGTTLPATNTDSIWLFGFSTENFVWANNSNTSDIPTALTGYAVAMTTSTLEVDNAYFANGNTAQTAVSVSGTKAVLMALFIDSAKYYTNDVGPLVAPAYTITVSASVTPTIIVSGTLSSFTTYTGTPSASQSYNLSGSNLTANIAVAAVAGYQYSTDNGTWLNSLSVASTYNGPVYVRLTGTTAGTYNGSIVHTSTGASPVNLALTGTVSNPTPTIIVNGTLADFSTQVGTPSLAQQYTVQALALTAGIVVTAPAGFEVSQIGSVYTPSITLASNYSGNVYIRLTGTTVGTYTGNVTHTSTGATQVDLAVSGTVIDAAGPTTFFQENFPYIAGTTLTSNGWTAHSSAGVQALLVANEGLTYTGYYAYTGLAGKTVFSGSAEDAHRTFLAQTAGTVYTSLLINASSFPNTIGDYIVHLGPNPLGTDFKGRVFVQKDTASEFYRFGITKASAAASAVWTDYVYALNTTYLIVLKYVINPGTNNDEVYLWVNPTMGTTEPAAQLSASDITGADAASIGAVAIRQGTNTPLATIDGIRSTNDWALLWDGTPPVTPVISVTGTLNPLACYINSPSEENQSYTINGTDLQGGITITAPTHFQVSLTGIDGWAQSLVASGTFPQTVYVRMFATEVGTQGGNITHTSPNANPVNLWVEGECFAPDVTWNITNNMTTFNTVAGTPVVQSYTLQALNATGDITLSTAAPFEMSLSSSGNWQNTVLITNPAYNGLVYVRFNPTGAGTFNGTITHVTPGVADYVINVSGIATPAAGMATDLFFSEYIEGSSNNKALEIFNGTGGPVDLSNYRVYVYANGAPTPNNSLFMTGILAHGDVYVIANSGANAAILALADITSNVTFYNGDDALAIVKMTPDSVLVDIIGMIDQDPGTAWLADGGYSTLDKTLVRKPSVTQGVSVNPSGYADGNTAAFETLATQWDVYPIDTISYLGTHTFNPGGDPMAATPVFNPPAGTYMSPINVAITSTTPGASIYYTTDGSIPDNTSSPYMGAIPISTSTTLKAIAYATGFDPSAVAMAIYSFPVNVATIAALRAMPTGATVYRLTGEAVLTFQQATRNQKYIQDATAAIVIDDAAGIITSTYSLYDGITGITGTLGVYNSLLQFTPVANPGAATSTGNVVVPAVRTLATITSDDQARLIKILNVTLDATTVNFGAVAENINATDASGIGVLRTFPATDYSGTAIPTTAVDIVALGGQFSTTMQFSPRFLADITPAGTALEAPIVTISEAGGTISLTWGAVAGATSYRVVGSNDPYGTYTTVATVTGTTWSGPAVAMRFFRVIAIN